MLDELCYSQTDPRGLTLESKTWLFCCKSVSPFFFFFLLLCMPHLPQKETDKKAKIARQSSSGYKKKARDACIICSTLVSEGAVQRILIHFVNKMYRNGHGCEFASFHVAVQHCRGEFKKRGGGVRCLGFCSGLSTPHSLTSVRELPVVDRDLCRKAHSLSKCSDIEPLVSGSVRERGLDQ